MVNVDALLADWAGFSALQRAENSSIERLAGADVDHPHVSVLFSEPKIPQFDNPFGLW